MKRLGLVALALAAAPAHAFTVASSGRGATLHWDSPSVSVALDAAAPSSQVGGDEAAAALAGALEAWNAASGGTLALSTGVAVNLVRFDDAWAYDPGLLAYTQLVAHEESGRIESALIHVNQRDHLFSTSGDSERYDLQAVLTHEVGHLLGLGHSLDAAATMFAGTAPGDPHQRFPDADDRAGLDALAAAAAAAPPQPSTAQPPLAGAACSFAAAATPRTATPPLAALTLAVALALARRRRCRPATK